jgi:hypothetical protein
MAKQKMVKKTFYFPVELFNDLKNYSEKTHQKISEVNRVAVLKYLNDHPLNVKRADTELTWEERNQFSYLFDSQVLVKLHKALRKAKIEGTQNEKI